MKKEIWEEVFEDDWKCINGSNDERSICLKNADIQELFHVYMNNKIKISVKIGKILIERIKEIQK